MYLFYYNYNNEMVMLGTFKEDPFLLERVFDNFQ